VPGDPAPADPAHSDPAHSEATHSEATHSGEAAHSGEALDGEALEVDLGPRDDWFTAAAVATLFAAEFTVTPASDAVGLRLDGPTLARARTDELPSEGVVRGSVQVPPDGKPIIFQADHPVTGGYPVIAVLTPAAADRAAQLRPGATVRFRPAARNTDRPAPGARSAAAGFEPATREGI
jgi:allophanate hydrolase subunit 2